MSSRRTETDALGEVSVPSHALWGADTQRAIDNFPVSSRRFPKAFLCALALAQQVADRDALEKLLDVRSMAGVK